MVVGASTGGPAALEVFIKELDVLDIPVLISIHMPKQFTESFAKRLSMIGKMPVRVAEDGEVIEAGVCYLARGGDSLEVVKLGAKVLTKYVDVTGPANILPSVDHMFETAANVFKDKLLGVVLTGMGRDGLIGSKEIKKNEGCIFIQDEKSCVVFGMPGSIFENNLEDGCFDINDLPVVINRKLKENEMRF
jgi:two-component system chemotaxis response regulator CheB